MVGLEEAKAVMVTDDLGGKSESEGSELPHISTSMSILVFHDETGIDACKIVVSQEETTSGGERSPFLIT